MKFPEGLQKLVFFLGGRMLWAYKEGISNILEKYGQNIKECIIYSAFSEIAHSFVNSTSSNSSNVASSNNSFRYFFNSLFIFKDYYPMNLQELLKLHGKSESTKTNQLLLSIQFLRMFFMYSFDSHEPPD